MSTAALPRTPGVRSAPDASLNSAADGHCAPCCLNCKEAQSWSEFCCQLPSAAGEAAEAGPDTEARRAQAARAVKKLGQKRVGNAFVVLRKLALHPLLARRLFSDAQVRKMAKIASNRYTTDLPPPLLTRPA